jgi:hypothetical protein
MVSLLMSHFVWELDDDDHLGAMGDLPEDRVELPRRCCKKNGIDLIGAGTCETARTILQPLRK